MSGKLDLFAGLPVSDYAAARRWYERLFGGAPTMEPHATEAVWGLAEHRWVYIVEDRERAGGGHATLLVDDLDARLADAESRGMRPDELETYSNGVRKALFRDPDGNEIGVGGS